MGCGLIQRSVEGIVAGTLKPVPQDSERATLAPILMKQDGNIDWSTPARAIYNRIRAFHPWPGSRTLFRKMICRVLKARVREGETSTAIPGTLVAGVGAKRSLAVTCGGGTLLELLEVQLPNRKPQTGLDLVNGFRIATGEILHHAE
jgi:methionyl-tRNA formyltransferase